MQSSTNDQVKIVKPQVTENPSKDEVETGLDMGGTTTAEALNWWADCFPQWQEGRDG